MFKQYNITKSASKTIDILSNNPKLFILSLISAILGLILYSVNGLIYYVIFYLISITYSFFSTITYWLSAEQGLKRKKINLKKVSVKAKKLIIPVLLVQLIYGLIIFAGSLLLIIPGIIFLVVLWPAPLVFIFEDVSITEAIKKSWSIGSKNIWLTLKLGLFSALIALIIIIILFLSILFIPILYLLIVMGIILFIVPFMGLLSGVIYLKALKK